MHFGYWCILRYTGNRQARREPQWGPGNHYRGALSLPHSICAEIETLKASRGRKRGEGCPITIWLWIWGSVVSSPSGVWGGSPAENGFYAYMRSERSHLECPFQYFWAMAGPPNVAGPRKTFTLSPLTMGLVVNNHLGTGCRFKVDKQPLWALVGTKTLTQKSTNTLRSKLKPTRSGNAKLMNTVRQK